MNIQDVSSLMSPTAAPQSGADAQKSALAFDAYFTGYMVKEMREAVPESVLNTGVMEVFGSLFDQAIGDAVAKAGGIGIAAMMGAEGSVVPEVAARIDQPTGATGGKPVEGRITSPFGWRQDPIDGDLRMHRGVDIGAPTGTYIRPVAAGTVTKATEEPGYGRVVVVDHGGGWTSLYAHCNELAVQPGQRVGAGDVLGTVGSTGRSTGPHLHFEVHRNGQAMDPLATFQWKNQSVSTNRR